MKRATKTLLSMFLALLLCIGLLPAVADGEYDFELATPTIVTMDFKKDYTVFEVSLLTLEGISPKDGQHLTLFLHCYDLSDGTHTIPLRVYNVSDYGQETEHLTGSGSEADAVFYQQTDTVYCAVQIPKGDYEPGTYTGTIYYSSEFWIEDYHSEVGDDGSIPVNITIPEKRDITIGEVIHGSVSTSGNWAYVGNTVTLTTTPESKYYELDSISAKCGGTPVTLTQSAEYPNQFSFVMPDGPVTVTAKFRAKGICEIHIFERVWDGFEITEPFTKGEDGMFHYNLRVEGEDFEDEYALLPYKRYDIGILIDGVEYTEYDPANLHTQNYYYIFDSTENLHLVEGNGYDGALDSRPMILVASQKGVYHFTLDAGERTLTVTHTYDDPDAEAYAYALGFHWMDEIPHPMGNAHTVAGTDNSYGFGDPIEEEDIYDFEGEETVWMSTEVYGGDSIANFIIGREGKTYGNKTVIHNVEPTGQLRELGKNGEECRLKPDFDEEYRGVYDLFYGIDSHKLMVFRRSVELMHDFTCPHYETYGNVQPQRITYEDGITIDREGTIYSGDEVTMSTAQYRKDGRLKFAGWYNADGFEWDEENGEPYGECVSTDNVYTFAPYGDTSLYAVYTETPFDDGYYVIGPDWTVDSIDRSRRFEENPDADGEYILSTTLTTGEEIKIVKVEDGTIAGWYPDGFDNQYHVDAAYAGDARIYFRPAYNGDWAVFGGHIWIVREYKVNVEKVTHGRVETETKRAAAGETVTLNIQSNGSYVLGTLTVLCGETEVETTCEDDWTYTFVMPAGDVTVTAVFKGEPYTATFVPEYGNEENYILQETEYGTLLTRPEDPVREGYSFGGWYEPDWNQNWWYEEEVGYRNEDCTLGELLTDWDGCHGDRYMRAWGFEEDTVSFDVTLYAKWKLEQASPKFATHSLVLSGQIGVNFYMDLRPLSDIERVGTYMIFTISGAGSVASEPVYFDESLMNSDLLYHKFTCYVNSIQMADTITATYHWFDDGVEKTVSENYSIKQYLGTFDTAVANGTITDAKTIDLVHALADYGHYVQLFLADAKGWTLGEDYAEMDRFYATGYDIEAIKTELSDYAIGIESSGADFTKFTFATALDSATTIRMQFTVPKGYSGTFTAEASDGTPVTVKKSGTRYTVEIADIPAHNLGKAFEITITTENGMATVNVSALSYVKIALDTYTDANSQNAMAAIYAYSKAAQEYKAAH